MSNINLNMEIVRLNEYYYLLDTKNFDSLLTRINIVIWFSVYKTLNTEPILDTSNKLELLSNFFD